MRTLGEPLGPIRTAPCSPRAARGAGLTRQPRSPPHPRIPRDPPSEPAAGDGPRCGDSFQARAFVCRPTVMLPGAQVWGPAPGDPPSARGSPGNPGGSPASCWSFGGAAAGGGTESPPPGVTATGAPPARTRCSGHRCSAHPRPRSLAGRRCALGSALLWQQDVVWDVTSPAACHPFDVGVRSRISRRDVPVLMPVPVKEHLGAVPPAAPFGGQGCQGVARTQPGQMLCSPLQVPTQKHD